MKKKIWIFFGDDGGGDGGDDDDDGDDDAIITIIKFHNFDQISQLWQNFTMLTKFHNFHQISQMLKMTPRVTWVRGCYQNDQIFFGDDDCDDGGDGGDDDDDDGALLHYCTICTIAPLHYCTIALLHLVPSPNAIAKAFNVYYNIMRVNCRKCDISVKKSV